MAAGTSESGEGASGNPDPELYQFKVECLAELEKLSEMGLIDLFYGDESHVCTEGYVPYGWQFPGEDVFIPSEKGAKINCFGLISRSNQCHFRTTGDNIDSHFICGELEMLSLSIKVYAPHPVSKQERNSL